MFDADAIIVSIQVIGGAQIAALLTASTAALRVLDSFGPDAQQDDDELVAVRQALRDAVDAAARLQPQGDE